jgi:hypothetical protein
MVEGLRGAHPSLSIVFVEEPGGHAQADDNYCSTQNWLGNFSR